MTGRGPQGGPPRRDPWRGGRDQPPSSRATSPADPTRPGIEVEELPTQSLAPCDTRRVPLAGAISVAAVVVLLAAGFGLLGGRSGTPGSPPPSSLGAALPSGLPSATEPPLVPRVTPWASCSAQPDQPPEAVLEVDGLQHHRLGERLELPLGPSFDGNAEVVDEGGQPEAIEVSMDSITDLWIVGGACAVAWNIDLIGSDVPGGLQTLETVGKHDRDPRIAAQNRFQVFVGPFAGDHLLRAVLVFDQFAVRTTWSIHVPRLEVPSVTLTAADGEIPTVIGCDVTQRLANDLVVPLNECGRDVRREPARRVDVDPGEELEFAIEDWAVSSWSVYCGQLMDRRFLSRAELTCVRDQDLLFAGNRSQAPEVAGPWTLAIFACARRFRATGNGFDELCGAWYANVLVRD